jgi:hypothetical protein
LRKIYNMDKLENAQKRAEYWEAESMAATKEINHLRTKLAKQREANAVWKRAICEVHDVLAIQRKEIEALRIQLAEEHEAHCEAMNRAVTDFERAVAAEREACAKVCENGLFLHDNAPDALFGKACARAIRARKEMS